MKRIILFISILLIVAAGGFILYQQRQIPAVTVLMTDQGFEPAEITVPRGTKVIFKNTGQDAHWPASDLHQTHGIYPEFDPGQAIEPGGEWSFVFKKKGTWKSHDHVVPQFRGVIRVE